MLKKGFIAAVLILALVLASCGSAGNSSGLLTDKEIEKLESLYFADSSAALKGLGFSENDLDTDSEAYEQLSSVGAYLLKGTRSIAGVEFRQIVMTSIIQPEGLFGVRFYATFKDEQEVLKVRDAISKQAGEMYMEPSELREDSRKAGELTEFSLNPLDLTAAANYSLDWDYRYSLELEYSMTSVVDGKLLSRDEMLEMVRSVQEKQ